MKYDPTLHHRRSIRLPGYDYFGAGAYFVTICTQHRQCLFGDLVDGQMRLNEAGDMVQRWYFEMENKFPRIQCGALTVMSNHMHFIMHVGADLRIRPGQTNGQMDGQTRRSAPANNTKTVDERHNGQTRRSAPAMTGDAGDGNVFLGRVVQWFKTMTTNQYIHGVKQYGWPVFNGRLWQRNYWEHIIRNETELNRVREYIQNNPAQWETDRLIVGEMRETVRRSGTETWMV